MSSLLGDRVNHVINLSAADVGRVAAAFLDRIKRWDEFPRFERSTRLYPDCWATYTGYPIIARWNLERDGGPLFEEALKALCLKAAVMHLTSDEKRAELAIPPAVDEMLHAMCAQFGLGVAIQEELGIPVVHMTDQEEFGYTTGDFTWQCYVAANWGEPPVRYWLSASVVAARLSELERLYESIGIHDNGRRHDITFTAADA
jgi:hypothetical protein